tara:strand:+ start:1004 stop:1180 length:177 start_codon:yes stop_codon:yes gene_type:complete
MSYQITLSLDGSEYGVKKVLEDGSVLYLSGTDNGTPEWAQYLEWVAEGNTPDPADSEE